MWIAGLVLLGLVGVYAALIVVDMIRRAARQRVQVRRENLLFQTALSSARRRRRSAREQALTWSGWRKFEVVRKECEDEDRQICSFYLAPHDRRPIQAYRPGQYLTLQVKANGRPKADVRCYSLSDTPDPAQYRITVKKVCPTGDSPAVHPGVVSCYLHENVEVGTILDVRPPGGEFFLNIDEPAPLVLVGGGIGITPMVAMANTVLNAGWPYDVWLFYGVRNRGEQVMRRHLEELARKHLNFHLRVCYSKPAADDREGQDYHHRGRVTADLLKSELKVNNYHFYLCGPGPMMDDMQRGLSEWQVPPERIHFETFGPSAPPSRPPNPDAAGPTVSFRRSDRTVKWDAGYSSVWDFASALGVPISSGCRAGKCGECKVAIVSGQVEYNIKPSYDCEPGSCLTCCCKPRGEVVLDA